MTNEKSAFDYNLILADLEGKRAALEAAITSLRIAMASGALVTNGVTPSASISPSAMSFSSHGSEVPSGAFLGKGVREAAALYLSLVKKKQTTREIAEALKKGGMESTSKRFIEMVGTVLNQAKKKGGGEILRIGDSWGLAEWYPAGFRSSVQEPKGKKRKVRKLNRKVIRRVLDQTAPALVPQGPSARIESFLLQSQGAEFSSDQIASKLNIDPIATAMLLGRLKKKGKVEKTANNRYRAPNEEAHSVSR